MTKVNPDHFNSDLKNFRSEEIDTIAAYSEQIREAAGEPEMLMYNWPRFVRTQEITRFLTFYEMYQQVREVHGNIFQVGVLEGNTLFTYAHLIENFEHRNYTRKIYAFDTYGDGDYAQLGSEDADYYNPDLKTIPKVSSFEKLKKSVDIFNKSRVFNQFQMIDLIKGNAAETVKNLLETNKGAICAVLNLQISMYEVEKEVLKLVWPRIPLGGIVHFASLGYEGSPGVGQMLDDALGITNCRIKRFSYGTKPAYIIKE